MGPLASRTSDSRAIRDLSAKREQSLTCRLDCQPSVNHYVIGLSAENCENGDYCQEQAEAVSREMCFRFWVRRQHSFENSVNQLFQYKNIANHWTN